MFWCALGAIWIFFGVLGLIRDCRWKRKYIGPVLPSEYVILCISVALGPFHLLMSMLILPYD